MQKKLIALAVAAAASTGAFAQTNVQIYGVVDYGYTLRHDRNQAGKDAGISKTNSRFDSGQSAGSRIGFKGVEDLGNGLKAVFVLERGFWNDTGADAGGFNRQAYVGLSGSYGTVVGGRVYTPYYTLVSGLDPFADGTVGTYHNVKADIFGGGSNVFNPVRVNNTVAYVSPNWGGFNFTAAYSNNAFSDDSAVRGAANNNVYAIAGNYVAPDWNIGLSYHYISAGKEYAGTGSFVDAQGNTITRDRTLKGVHNITLGGAYDFKAVKVSAFLSYDKASYKENALGVYPTPDNKKSVSQTNFMLGAVAPFGKHAVKGSFNYSYNSKNQYGKAWQLAVGYDYNFSKRTNFYAAYSYINADKAKLNGRAGRDAFVGDATNEGGSYGYSYTDAAGVSQLANVGYRQGFQLGIKHSF